MKGIVLTAAAAELCCLYCAAGIALEFHICGFQQHAPAAAAGFGMQMTQAALEHSTPFVHCIRFWI